jgi:hypothetical protein
MRIAYSAFVALMLVSAVPSVSFAQIVIPYSDADVRNVDRLDHPVPVATVVPATESVIALDHPKTGDGFVLGAAKLDLKDPDHPMVVFSMTNAAQTPMMLSTVLVDILRVNSRAEDGAISIKCRTGPWLSRQGRGDTALQPGATITVEAPIAGRCPALGETVGFLVYLQSDGRAIVHAEVETIHALDAANPDRVGPYRLPRWVEENENLHKAFETLRSLSQQ